MYSSDGHAKEELTSGMMATHTGLPIGQYRDGTLVLVAVLEVHLEELRDLNEAARDDTDGLACHQRDCSA